MKKLNFEYLISNFAIRKYLFEWALIAATACIMFILCGCVAKRGVEFGHWARTGESINMIRVFTVQNNSSLTGSEKVLILPPIGKVPRKNLQELQRSLQQEMQNYFTEIVFTLSRNGHMAEYLQENNLTITSDQFNFQEIGRIGKLVGVSHVLCVLVREFRPYPPQILALHIALVETVSNRAIAEMDATFDASEQVVVLAADEYLQSRLARNYDIQSLDIVLRSPSEYCAFVSTLCCRTLAERLRQNKALKKPTDSTDKKI